MKKLSILILLGVITLINSFSLYTNALTDFYESYDISVRDSVRIDTYNGYPYNVGTNAGSYVSQKIATKDNFVAFENLDFNIIFWYAGDILLGYTYNTDTVAVDPSALIINGVDESDAKTNIYPVDSDATHFIVAVSTVLFDSGNVDIFLPMSSTGILSSGFYYLNYDAIDFGDFDDSIRNKYTYDLLANTVVNVDSGAVSTSETSFYEYKYTTTRMAIVNEMVYYELPFYHVIFWYSGTTYLGYSYNIEYSVGTMAGPFISRLGPDDINTNIYPVGSGATHFRIMIVESSAADSNAYINYNLGLPANRLDSANFYYFARNDISYTVTFPKNVDGNYIGRRVNLDFNYDTPGIIYNSSYWLLSEPVEIKNEFVGNYPNVRFTPGYDPLNNTLDLSNFTTTGTYNFDIITWYDNSTYLGFSVTDNINLISSDLLPDFYGYITTYDIGKNIIPVEIFFTVTHFRVMSWRRDINKTPYTAPFPTGAFPDPVNMGNFLLDNNDLSYFERVGVKFYNFADLITRFTYVNYEDIENYDFMYLKSYNPPISVGAETFWNNILSALNLNNSMGRLIASVLIMGILAIVLFIFKASLGVVLFTIIISIVTFGAMGWIDRWLLLSVVVITAFVVVLKVFSSLGSGGSD